MEKRYWELREAVDRAWDNFIREPNAHFKLEYDTTLKEYMVFCSEVLEKLMDENSDVLKHLKDA